MIELMQINPQRIVESIELGVMTLHGRGEQHGPEQEELIRDTSL
jgi:hypothetical protein